MKNQKTILISLGAIAAFVCVLAVGGLAGASWMMYQQGSTPTESITQAESQPGTTTSSNPAAEAAPARVNPVPIDLAEPTSTETLLNETEIPDRDLRQIASQLKHKGEPLPETVSGEPPAHNLGDQDTFWVTDNSAEPPKQLQLPATLKYITDHTYWWVQDGYNIDPTTLAQSAETFETKTYPTNREFFGSEWTPGVDNDPHLSIFLGDVPGVGGYFTAHNEYTKEVHPYSNQREMFFINIKILQSNDTSLDSTLVHEFQHMIHWYQDRNEDTWVNEGLSELATYINGYDPGRAQDLYLERPDLQLTAWGSSLRSLGPYYGCSYLFMVYFLQRFGEETLKTVVADPANGIHGFNAGLKAANRSETFDDVFADFIIANYLNDPSLADGRYGYQNMANRQAEIDQFHGRFPAQQETTVHQYGVDYIELQSDQPLTINFEGETIAHLLDNNAHSGSYQWYSNRSDSSNTTLTRAVDLSGVEAATLNYWVWYDIEEDWDYAYVEASTNDGHSWQLLHAPGMRDTNPSGNGYGPGYTGTSRGWRQESIDLSELAGQKILLRFEYITDDAVNGPGLALDDISIPEIGFSDDMETLDPAWQAEGFIRMDNLLRQHYTVQVIELDETPTIVRLNLDEANHGSLTVGQAGQAVHAVLVVSAQAPVTTEVATYRYTIETD